jgi:hypothetical protein
VQGARNGGLTVAWRVVSSTSWRRSAWPLVRGRAFAAKGEQSHSMLVSESVAKKLWPNREDPSASRSRWEQPDLHGRRRGGDVRQPRARREPPPTVYMSPNWSMLSTMTLALKTRVDPEQAIAQVREAAVRTIPEHPLFEIRPMSP